jgi:hypothetical protein
MVVSGGGRMAAAAGPFGVFTAAPRPCSARAETRRRRRPRRGIAATFGLA